MKVHEPLRWHKAFSIGYFAVLLLVCVVLSGYIFSLPFLQGTHNFGATDPLLVGWAVVSAGGAALAGLVMFQGMSGSFSLYVFTVLCVIGACLSATSCVAHIVSIPSSSAAAAVHAISCLSYCLLYVFHGHKRRSSSSSSSSQSIYQDAIVLVSLLILCGSVTLSAGMAAQAVNVATRFQIPSLRPVIGGVELFLSCSGYTPNATTIILVVPSIDHSASFYAIFSDQLADAGIVCCTYDPAGNGFSDAGPLPRSLDALGVELAGLGNYVATLNPTLSFFLAAFGHGGLVARKALQSSSNFAAAVTGIILIDSASEWDSTLIGKAMHMTPSQWVNSVTDAAVAQYMWQHLTAALGSCLLHPLPYTKDGFPPLPPAYQDMQIRARCNGGSMALTSASAASLMYYNVPTSSLGTMPLLICCSSGPFLDGELGQAMREVQQNLETLSSNSDYKEFPQSEHVGDLPVLWAKDLVSFLTQWLNQQLQLKK